MRTSINLSNATIHIQMTKEVYADLLSYFGCTKRGQLSIMSGEVFDQGRGWYLAILNEKFAAGEAADRFLTAINIAFKHGKVIQAAKQKLEEVTKNIREFQIKAKRRVVKVDQIFHHGRQFSVARTHVASAFWNRDYALTGYIKDAMASSSIAPRSSLNSLVSHFAH